MGKPTIYCFQDTSHGEAVGFIKYFVPEEVIPPQLKGEHKSGWREGGPMCRMDLNQYKQYLIRGGTAEEQIQEGTIEEYIQGHPEVMKPSPFKETLWRNS